MAAACSAVSARWAAAALAACVLIAASVLAPAAALAAAAASAACAAALAPRAAPFRALMLDASSAARAESTTARSRRVLISESAPPPPFFCWSLRAFSAACTAAVSAGSLTPGGLAVASAPGVGSAAQYDVRMAPSAARARAGSKVVLPFVHTAPANTLRTESIVRRWCRLRASLVAAPSLLARMRASIAFSTFLMASVTRPQGTRALPAPTEAPTAAARPDRYAQPRPCALSATLPAESCSAFSRPWRRRSALMPTTPPLM